MQNIRIHSPGYSISNKPDDENAYYVADNVGGLQEATHGVGDTVVVTEFVQYS